MIYPDQNYLGMSAFQVASREVTKSSSTPACIRTEQASGGRGGNVSMRVSANEPSLLSGSPCCNCSFTAAHAQSQIMGAERGGGEHPVSDITERAVQRTGHSTPRPPPLRAVSPSHGATEKRARTPARALPTEEKNIFAYLFEKLRGKMILFISHHPIE